MLLHFRSVVFKREVAMFESLTDQDRQEWESYINNVLSKPEQLLIPIKEPSVIARRLDLHGMTVGHAHGRVNDFIAEHHEAGTESVVIITGKSGQISYEFQDWCKQHRCVRQVEPIIDSRGGIGSYRIWFKKTRTNK